MLPIILNVAFVIVGFVLLIGSYVRKEHFSGVMGLIIIMFNALLADMEIRRANLNASRNTAVEQEQFIKTISQEVRNFFEEQKRQELIESVNKELSK